MSDENDNDTLADELVAWVKATMPLVRRIPNAVKSLDKLTGGSVEAGVEALKARMRLARTRSLSDEAKVVADNSGLPLPVVFDHLAKQRRIDEMTVEAIRRAAEKTQAKAEEAGDDANAQTTDDRWFDAYRLEASMASDDVVREAFVRVLAGEIEDPGAFSVRTLRVMGSMNQVTAARFRRAASVSVRLEPGDIGGKRHVMDARIPAMGGRLGSNALKEFGLPYDVLTDLTENGLLHPDYGSGHPYGQIYFAGGVLPSGQASGPLPLHMRHQGPLWDLVPEPPNTSGSSLRIEGAALTSVGIELLGIVDIEEMPAFTERFRQYLTSVKYRMVEVPEGTSVVR